ncbi:S-adenosyl-L-methionine-dependent methyltransferases superfamily protein [Prunus dulcis]|uniref:O-fucosyltransferase family protein n=1 Tax=Prunus dulcis TaxID=3755 RepID=A0A4Y1R672_PRUDU|nr:S-adenosyl-L-methionine-dependent methyltransferases superfamily protein [Prunus dulcis]
MTLLIYKTNVLNVAAADVKTYLLTAISGGLNQQRRGITDALVVAYILNATLLVLKLGQNYFGRIPGCSAHKKTCFLKGLISWVIRLVAFNLGYLPGGDKTIIRVRNNTEQGIGSCKKDRGAWRSYQFSGLCGASWWMASNPDKVRSEYKSFQGKVLHSVRVSDPGLLLKPDEPNLIIMAKPAGGPSKRDQHAGMDED